jgi:uncharacterized repeat protein (TIGR03803 family)
MKRHFNLGCVAWVLVAMATCGLAWSQEQVIFPFSAQSLEDPLFSSPVVDSVGNLYVAGTYNEDVLIYKLVPPTQANNPWVATQIAAVYGTVNPPNPGLVADSQGHLFGTANSQAGQGLAFEVDIATKATTTIYNFQSYTLPTSPLIVGPGGTIYGASYSGATGCGTVFELTPPAKGQRVWSETTLYTFLGPNDGCEPTNVVLDEHGNAYGATLSGGTNNLGTIFELIPPSQGSGTWTEETIHTFTSADVGKRKLPNASVPPKGYVGLYENAVAIDDSGNLFGTTFGGGTTGNGSVYELSPSGGSWNFAILYSFAGIPDGASPAGNVTIGKGGVLYGTTLFGGPVTAWGGGITGLGTLWELTPPTQLGGAWTEKILRNFTGGYDGAFPITAPIYGPAGNLYGVTASGGYNNFTCAPVAVGYGTGCGAVYEYVP